ncbi:hypothetical protein [Microcystis phage Mel-JY01]
MGKDHRHFTKYNRTDEEERRTPKRKKFNKSNRLAERDKIKNIESVINSTGIDNLDDIDSVIDDIESEHYDN